jgi:hypothetical protein
MEEPKPLGEKYLLCDICYEEKELSEFFGLSCNHKFCKACLENIWGQTLRMVKWSRSHACSMAVRMSSWKLISRHSALRQFLRSMYGFDC